MYDQARVELRGDLPPLFVGTLHARLLSGRLGSRIDESVSSSTLVIAPLPGVLYTISEGPRRGLWFAAL
jgi:hypothetical protein